MVFHQGAENADGRFHVRGHPPLAGDELAPVGRIDAAADPRAQRHLGACAGESVEQPAALADQHRRPLERLAIPA